LRRTRQGRDSRRPTGLRSGAEKPRKLTRRGWLGRLHRRRRGWPRRRSRRRRGRRLHSIRPKDLGEFSRSLEWRRLNSPRTGNRSCLGGRSGRLFAEENPGELVPGFRCFRRRWRRNRRRGQLLWHWCSRRGRRGHVLAEEDSGELFRLLFRFRERCWRSGGCIGLHGRGCDSRRRRHVLAKENPSELARLLLRFRGRWRRNVRRGRLLSRWCCRHRRFRHFLAKENPCKLAGLFLRFRGRKRRSRWRNNFRRDRGLRRFQRSRTLRASLWR
jgi:hypothetical protein